MRIAAFLLAAGIAHGAVSDLAVVYDRIPSGETEGKVAILNIGGSVLGASITFTAAGAWSVNKSTCNSNFKFNPTSGTAGAQTVRVMPDDIASQSISAGQNQVTGTCTGDVDGTGFTIRWLVRRARAGYATDFNGLEDSGWSGGCNASNSLHVYKNQCTATTAYAPQDGVALPAAGSTITDPLFGGKGLRCGGSSSQPYGTYSFSRDDDYYISADGIISTADCSVLAPLPATSICGGYSTMYWDKRPTANNLSGWCHYDNTPFTVKAWHISGGAVVDDGVIFTHTHDLQDHGSTGTPINPDGWAVFPSNNQFCTINYAIGSSSLKCAAIKGTAGARVRHVQIAPRPDSDGILRAFYGDDAFGGGVEEYVFYELNVIADTWTMVDQITRFDGSWITFGDNWGADTGYSCTPGNSCITYGHANAGWVNGKSYIVGNPLQMQARSFIWGFNACSMSNGTGDSCFPQELGGGAISRFFAHGAQYVVCAVNSPVCVMGNYGTESRARRVTATESGGTCTGTVSGTNVFTTSQRVLMNKFSTSGWNGYVTLGSSSGSTITWPCTGAGTSLVGYAIDATVLADGTEIRWSSAASRADNGHIRVLAKWQGTTNADVSTDTYSDAVLPQVSTSGNLMKINDSMGYPEQGGITLLYTGFEGCTERTKPNDFCGGGGLRVIPLSDTTARAIVTTPYADGACTLAWGATIDYSGATTQALSAGTTVREYTITGLTASTKYYLNVKCAGVFQGTARTNWHYAIDEMTTLAAAPGGSVAYSFLLPEAPTGTVTYRVEYGTTSGLGTQFDDGCSAGEKCHTTISLARGVVYYRYKWLDGSSAVIRETPIVSRVLR